MEGAVTAPFLERSFCDFRCQCLPRSVEGLARLIERGRGAPAMLVAQLQDGNRSSSFMARVRIETPDRLPIVPT
jgi:hypothetical protein